MLLRALSKCPLNTNRHGGINHLSRKIVPVFDNAHGKEIFLNFQSEPPLAQPYAILLCSICSEITQLSCLNSASVKTVTAKENERCKAK